MNQREAGEAVRAAMKERGLTLGELAAQMGRPRVWIAAAVLGQHPFSHEEAERLGVMLGLPAEAVARLWRSLLGVRWMPRCLWTRRSTVCTKCCRSMGMR